MLQLEIDKININFVIILEVADRLRQSKKNYLKPLVAITAFAFKFDESEFLNNGFTNYISKPFEKKELNYLIMQLI